MLILLLTRTVEKRQSSNVARVSHEDNYQCEHKYHREKRRRRRRKIHFRYIHIRAKPSLAKALQATHVRLIKTFDKEVEWVDKHLSKEISEVTEWRQTYYLLKSVPGIGDGVAHTLLGELPELGSLTARLVAQFGKRSTSHPVDDPKHHLAIYVLRQYRFNIFHGLCPWQLSRG